ncbi:MAG: hypothetical protein AB7L17_09320 [Ilumatobacteraceae bacterium]
MAAASFIGASLIAAAGCSSDSSKHLPRALPTTTPLVDEGTTPPAPTNPIGTLVPPGSVAVDDRPTDTSAPGGDEAPTTGAPVEQFQDALVFDPFVVNDPMAGGVDAIALLVPRGWNANAGVQWLPEWIRAAFLQTHVDDPFTGISIDWLPIQDFISFPPPSGFEIPIGGNYQGKAYVPPITDPAQLVTQMWVPGTLPELQNATLVDVQQVPAIAQEFLRGFGGPGDAYAYRMRYEYSSNGQPWEEDVSFAVLYSGDQNLTSWYVNFAYAVRGPKGTLDANAGLVSTVVASRTTTPQWEATYRKVQQLFTQGIQQQMADTVAFGKALEAYRNEINALQQQVTAERQASQDRIAELRGETLAGIDTYTDPFSGTLVQLPTGWNDYWVNDQGEYIASDDPAFDPNSLNDGVWQQLEVVPFP